MLKCQRSSAKGLFEGFSLMMCLSLVGGLAPSRSANTSNANNARNVTATGGNDNNNANNANYVAPDLIWDIESPDVSTETAKACA